MGHKNPLQFTLLYSQWELTRQVVIALCTLWQNHLNLQVTLHPCDWGSFLDRKQQGEFQMAHSRLQAAYGEPSALLSRYLSYNNRRRNCSGYDNSRFDHALEQACYALDTQERYCYYQQAEQLLAQDAPFIPLYYYIDVRLVKPWIIGLSPHNQLGTFALQDLSIQQLK